MTAEEFNRIIRAMGTAGLEHEVALSVFYERAFGAAGRFYATHFEREVVTASSWVPPAGTPAFDSERALAAARAEREDAAAAIEAKLAERVAGLAISFDPDKFKVFSPDLLESLGQHASRNFDASARETLAKTIQASFDQGLSVPDTARAIRAGMVDQARHVAIMLARTDLISLANGGAFLAARQVFEEIGGTKIWLNAHDARVRKSHAFAGGQEVPLEAPFIVGGHELMYPGDPQGPPSEVINCRCTFTVGDAPKRVAKMTQPLDLAPPKGETALEIFGQAKDTEALFADAKGVYSEARRPLHQQMAAWSLRSGATVPAGTQPQTMFLAGGSGVGKSTVRRALSGPEKPYRPVTIDADAYKVRMPEYKQMIKTFDTYSAWGVHEESSTIAKQVLKAANARRKNVIVDGTGDSEPGKFLEKIKEQQALGNKVNVVLVDAPIETAIGRVNARAIKTGRHISEATVRDIHQKVAARFHEWREETDWQLWAADGGKGSKPKLVAGRVNGTEAIYDPGRFKQFLDKANG